MITFTTEPHKTIENLFNNQVYEFNVTDGVSCVVVITEGVNVREVVIDGINGFFYVDLKKTIQSLFNIDNFEDKKVPTPITWLINDVSLYRAYTIDFYVTLSNATVVTDQRIQKYTKAVDQITKPLEIENTVFKVLSNSKYYNYYEGLPFDVSIYSDTNRTVTITNTRTGISTFKDFTVGVNRLYLSNGENTQGFENQVPLVLNKINQIEFYDGLVLLETIEVYKHEECEAPYLKWFNSKGGYSYFRFLNTYQRPRAYSNNEFLVSDFKNIEDTIGNFKTTGKTASESIVLTTDTLHYYDVDNFKDLYLSPKVYFYTTLHNQPITTTSFKEVSIANGTFNFENTKRESSQYQVIVDLPNLYTQTYI